MLAAAEILFVRNDCVTSTEEVGSGDNASDCRTESAVFESQLGLPLFVASWFSSALPGVCEILS